jgi:hypothetical protein
MRFRRWLLVALVASAPSVVAGTWFAASPVLAADYARDGLILNWEAVEVSHRADLSLVGEARFADGPARIECGGRAAVVASKPLRPERLSIEAAFRVARGSGPLQLIVTTYPPEKRVVYNGAGNARQWVLQITANVGRLDFGIFGEDQRWHMVRSEMHISKGWHHALGTFDGKQVRLFLDGRLQSESVQYAGRVNRPPDGLVNLPAVGGNALSPGSGFESDVALVRMYDRALAQAEAAGNYAYAKGLVPALAQVKPARKPVKPPFKVLYSNDFTNVGIISPYHKKGEPFQPAHLQASVDEAAGADVHLLQPAHGAVPWWPSKLYPLAEHHAWWSEHYGIKPEVLSASNDVHRYILNGGDPFKVFIEECRKVGQSPFISMRLNDTHHLLNADMPHNRQGIHSISRFYVEHPEYRLGRTGTGLNWAIPEVRARMFGFLKEICENYDIDGLELDFMRFPYFFKDETPLAQREEIITRFVADVRQALDAGGKPGRRRWLCARVPCRLEMLPAIGIDLLELVDAGLDMVNLSASYFTVQDHDLASVRRMLPETAVYLEMCHCTMLGKAVGNGGDRHLFLRTTDQQYYTAAHMAYRRGTDGLSLFNFVYTREHGLPGRGPWNEPPFHVLAHLKDPAWLAKQPQWYVLSDTWGAPMKVGFVKGDARTFKMDMSPNEHQRKQGVLRLMTVEAGRGVRWMVKVNGVTLEPTGYVAKPIDNPYDGGIAASENYACFKCPRQVVHEGINRIAVILEAGGPATVQSIDLALP